MAIGSFKLPIAAGGAPSEPTTGLWRLGRALGVSNIGAANALFPSDTSYKRIESNSFSSLAVGVSSITGIIAGELYTMGSEYFGVTGSGANNGGLYRPLAKIGGDTDWTLCAISGNVDGQYSTFYAIRAGRLYVTGGSALGQAGNGSTATLTTFTQIGSDTNWEMVDGGDSFAAAIKGGILYTTGTNANARTGLNTATGTTTSWTQADSNTDWTWVSCGRLHGAGIRDGRLYTWGANANGATGQNTVSGNTLIPTQVGSATNWTKAFCGPHNTHVINSSGEMWATGINNFYQLGDGTNTQRQVLVQVGSDTDWTFVVKDSISAPGSPISYTIALKGGKLVGVGSNEFGQIDGIGSTATFTTWQEIGAATNHSLIATCGGLKYAVRT